jgi:ribosome-associated protein
MTTPKTPSKRPRKRAIPRKRISGDLTAAVAAALDKKAENLVVLDLTKASAFTDFFVICTGTNRRQVQAIADAVQEATATRGLKPALVEGYGRGEWVLIDYFDFIIHIFMPSTREFYALERLWGDAQRVEIRAASASSNGPTVQRSKGPTVVRPTVQGSYGPTRPAC